MQEFGISAGLQMCCGLQLQKLEEMETPQKNKTATSNVRTSYCHVSLSQIKTKKYSVSLNVKIVSAAAQIKWDGEG